MRLFEAIIDANHRAVAGDQNAGVHPAEFESELPMVALTCIDVRLNPLLPEVLGVPKEQFIWLRNAGNIITGPLSSTMRSLALACVVKGGKEIAIIGHTDCQVGKTTMMELIDRFRAMGIERHLLPANVNEFFGMFSSERANVIKAVDVVRSSPLIGPKIPVHGLLVDIETGKVEWLVNGYQTLETRGASMNEAVASASHKLDDVEVAHGCRDRRDQVPRHQDRRYGHQSGRLAFREAAAKSRASCRRLRRRAARHAAEDPVGAGYGRVVAPGAGASEVRRAPEDAAAAADAAQASVQKGPK